jgi:hypothetical protein
VTFTAAFRSAQRLRCASAIRARPSALMTCFRRCFRGAFLETGGTSFAADVACS